MLDSLARNVLAGVTMTLGVVILAGEFVDLPYIKLPKFSKFSNYFLCLLATTHFAWANLGRTFSGRNSPAGAFYALCRTISLAVCFSACLDHLSKAKVIDTNLTLGIKVLAGIMFISMVASIRSIVSLKISRQVVLKCGDPTSQTLILNGLIQFIIALALLTYPMSVSSIMSTEYKIKTFDLLVLRSFAALDLGLSMMNFAAVGLSDEDAAAFLNVRKVQYVMMLTLFVLMQYLNYFAAVHTFVILCVIIQFVYILLPKVKEELKTE